jgi:alkaline phosphatase D
MRNVIDRRLLLKTGIFGLGALTLPGGALAAMQAALTPGFSHGVASGEPGPTSVLLWTRYVADAAESKLDVEIWEGPNIERKVTGGQAIAASLRDHTAKIVVNGLKPGTSYNHCP